MCNDFFQFVPKLTPACMNEIEKILCNRPVRVREHMQRWLDAGSSGGGGSTAAPGSSSGGATGASHKEGVTSSSSTVTHHHVIPAHTTMPRHGKMDPTAAAAATPGCTLQWPPAANQLSPNISDSETAPSDLTDSKEYELVSVLCFDWRWKEKFWWTKVRLLQRIVLRHQKHCEHFLLKAQKDTHTHTHTHARWCVECTMCAQQYCCKNIFCDFCNCSQLKIFNCIHLTMAFLVSKKWMETNGKPCRNHNKSTLFTGLAGQQRFFVAAVERNSWQQEHRFRLVG